MLVYATIALLAFVLASGVGAIGALVLRGDLALPGSGKDPGPSREQGDARQPQGDTGRVSQGGAAEPNDAAGEAMSSKSQQDGATQQEGSAAQESEAAYITKVGDIQEQSVDTFLDCHAKLRRYDALSAQDIEELRVDQAALEGLVEQVEDIEPPQGYAEQYEAFRSAISYLHEGAQLAYSLSADPVAATQSKFGEYDRLVKEADARLQESNEILGRDYRSLEDVQRASVS